MKHLTALRYVAPLREGGSMPAIVEADDNRLWVLKFRGAGQGRKALIAELVAGEIARLLGLPVPELVFMELDARLGISEPDAEIRSLILASVGLNLAMRYLPSALTFDPLASLAAQRLTPLLASQIVWFDALVTNIDRTAKNPNLLISQRQLWLIDHGAAFYFHHTWQNHMQRSQQPFAAITDHVLIRFATVVAEIDASLAAHLDAQSLQALVAMIPDAWLTDEPPFATPDAVRAAYLDYLLARSAAPRDFVTEAIRAHARTV
ncbi:MAG: HipA family kinase [Chloroflexota bacterium]